MPVIPAGVTKAETAPEGKPAKAHHDIVKDALKHHRAGRLSEAAQMYGLVLSAEPDNADCLHLLGMIAYQTGNNERAVELIRKAIAIHNTAASYYSNLGNVLRTQQKMVEAEACYRHSLAIHPDQAEVHLNLGNILKAQGQVDSALASYQRALSLSTELAEAQVAESMALLLKGEFGLGWQAFEARWRTQEYDTRPRSYPQPLWRGERLASGRVLIWGEQGVGDEVMFSSLIRDVIASGSRCVLECDIRLQPLFGRSFPGVEIVSGYDPRLQQELDIVAHLPSGSLPGLFRKKHNDFATSRSSYLVADALKRKRFRARYEDGRPLVGIAWHTRNKKSGHSRSIDLAQLAPLISLPGVRWVSLQYGDHIALKNEALTAEAPLLIDAEVDQLTDLDTFAAQVAAMDLVITIDNSTAHLAAALGIPTWTLLPFAPDWRWLLGREDSPWYPTMRLFRQPIPGDWQTVVAQVQAALATTFHRR
jgi:tetratricopeptide (TPR) repeat protein